MARVKLDSECLRQVNLFCMITNIVPKDCIVEDDRVLFLVNEGKGASAVGKGGMHIRNLEKILNKKVEVVEYSKDLLKFLNNIFRPLVVKEIKSDETRNNKRIITISVEPHHTINPRMFIISKVKKLKVILKKYFNIDEIRLS